MKRVTVGIFFVLLLYVGQSSLLPFVAFRGVSADLLLLMVVSVAFLRGAKVGALVGFLAGLLQDLGTGTFFGVDIFAKMIIGYGCGYFSRRLVKEQMMLPLLAVLAATSLQYLIWLLFYWLLGYSVQVWAHWRHLLLPMMAHNVIFALPVHVGVSKFLEWMQEKKG
ncbi:MAG: rod shape-determining protein MreD [Schwartzia sp. (in: firmicutes)]